MTDTRDLPGFTLRCGPLTISWASLFGARIRYVPRSVSGSRVPLFERLTTQQETEEPWRKGHGFTIRFWPTSRALMLGWWGDPQVDDVAGETRGLYEALTPGQAGQRKYTPVTNLLGPISPGEVVERASTHVPDSVMDETNDGFEIIDLRNGTAL